MKTLFKLLILSILLILPTRSNATHMMGGDITYECISPGKYKLTVKIYRDCRGIPFNNPLMSVFCADGGSISNSVNLNYTRVGIKDITPICLNGTPPCNPQNQTAGEGIEEHTFEAIVDYDEISSKLPKSVIYLLSMVFMAIKDKYKITNYELFVEHWYDKFLEKENSDEIVFKRKGKSLVFTQLLSGLVMDTDQLEQMNYIIESEFIPFLEEEGAISPYNSEEFTTKQKRDWINIHKFKDGDKWYVKVRNNTSDLSFRGVSEPEFITITLAQSFNGSKYELDHIHPKSKGGETTIENAELTTREYNRKKRAKILNDSN